MALENHPKPALFRPSLPLFPPVSFYGLFFGAADSEKLSWVGGVDDSRTPQLGRLKAKKGQRVGIDDHGEGALREESLDDPLSPSSQSQPGAHDNGALVGERGQKGVEVFSRGLPLRLSQREEHHFRGGGKGTPRRGRGGPGHQAYSRTEGGRGGHPRGSRFSSASSHHKKVPIAPLVTLLQARGQERREQIRGKDLQHALFPSELFGKTDTSESKLATEILGRWEEMGPLVAVKSHRESGLNDDPRGVGVVAGEAGRDVHGDDGKSATVQNFG